MTRFYIDLQRWIDYQGDVIQNIVFVNCTNVSSEVYQPFTQLTIQNIGNGRFTISVVQNGNTYSYDETDYDEFVQGDDFTFDAGVSVIYFDKIITMIDEQIIAVNQDGNTTLFVYKQNSENDALSKDLTPVNIFDGKFNHAIGLKNINVDIFNYGFNFNYVYIPLLERYYYVDSVELISADFSRLHLKEDVLMTWKNLIRNQDAFVTRNENITDYNIVDDRLPLESVKSIEYLTPSRTSTGNLENITLKGDFTTEYNIMLSDYNDALYSKTNIVAPDSYLPTLSPNQSACQTTYFLTLDLFDSFTKALLDEETMVSAINSVLFLPFDPQVAFNTGTSAQTLLIGLPDSKALCSDDKFHYLYDIPSGVVTRQVRKSAYGTSPYLILADFTFPDCSDNYYLHEPYTIYEIYIAFVGWVKVDISQVSNKRILIYYTLDYQTGNGTAYLYNKTDGKIIYSCGCQLGVKLDIISSNALELSRERQATQLNTLIGLLASAVSIGAGVVTENPVAIAGGVLSAGKTIANAVNKERMMFERAQVTYGSGDAGLHSNLATLIRRTYNKKILLTDPYEFDKYKHMQGIPCNRYLSLTNFTGYTEIGEIHFNPKNYRIYQDEISEIVELLQKGVIL